MRGKRFACLILVVAVAALGCANGRPKPLACALVGQIALGTAGAVAPDTEEDLDLLLDIGGNIAGRTICALGDAAVMPVQGMLKHFRDEFQYHIDHKKCMVG